MDAKSSSSSSSLVSDTNEKKTSGDDSFRDGLVDEINRKRKRAEEMEQELHRVNKELRRANKELKDYDYKKEQERNRFEWERVLSDHSKWRVFYEEYKGFKKSYSDVIQSSLRPILDACLRVNEDEVKSLIQFALDNEFRLGYSPLNPKFVMKYLDFSMDTSKRKWSVEEAEQFAKKWQIFNITCNKAKLAPSTGFIGQQIVNELLTLNLEYLPSSIQAEVHLIQQGTSSTSATSDYDNDL